MFYAISFAGFLHIEPPLSSYVETRVGLTGVLFLIYNIGLAMGQGFTWDIM